MFISIMRFYTFLWSWPCFCNLIIRERDYYTQSCTFSDQDACVCGVLDYKCLSVTLQKLFLDRIRSIETLQFTSGHQVERPKRHFKMSNFGAQIKRFTARHECRQSWKLCLLLDIIVWEGFCNNGQWIKTIWLCPVQIQALIEWCVLCCVSWVYFPVLI